MGPGDAGHSTLCHRGNGAPLTYLGPNAKSLRELVELLYMGPARLRFSTRILLFIKHFYSPAQFLLPIG